MKRNLGILIMMVMVLICTMVAPSAKADEVVHQHTYTYVKVFFDCKSNDPKSFIGARIKIDYSNAIIDTEEDRIKLFGISQQTFTVTEKNHGYFVAKLMIMDTEEEKNCVSWRLTFWRKDGHSIKYSGIDATTSAGKTFKFFDVPVDIQPLKAKTGADNAVNILWKQATGPALEMLFWPKGGKPIRIYLLKDDGVYLSPAWKCPEWKDWPEVVEVNPTTQNQKINVKFKEIFKK